MSGCGAVASARGVARFWVTCAVALGVLLAGVLLWSAAAEAALVHPFIGTIQKNKKGFSEEVCGVSVDPASGEIFVSDPGLENVQVFDKSGALLAGRTISSIQVVEEETEQEKTAREEKEKVEIEKGKTPKEVAGKFEKEELEEFCSTAENDKNGHLYIADGGEHAIYPFDKEGKQVFATNKEGKRVAGAEITGKETPAGELGEELFIAVDQKTGRLYVSDREHEAVYMFSEEGKYEGQLAFPGSAENEHLTEAIAVDQQTGEVYVAVQGQAFDEEDNQGLGFVYVFDSSGAFLREISGHASGAFSGFGAESEPLLSGLAVGPERNLYVSSAVRRAVFEFDPAGDFIGEITGTSSGAFNEPRGIATSSAGNVYVADSTEETNRIRRQAEAGLEPLPGLLDVFGPAITSASPTIESESVSDLTATSATLHANIDPTGVDTSYYFELCRESACTTVPAPPGTDIGAGEVTQAVSQPFSGLQANTIYTYRVIATFAGGASTVAGAVQTFTTQTEGASVVLPDGRAWEMVSSPEKGGIGLEAIPREGGLIQAAADGSGLTYIALAPEGSPEGNRVPTFSQLLAKRSSTAWLSKGITLPGEHATGAITGEGKQEYRAFTPDLELSLVEPLGLSTKAEPALSLEDLEDPTTERTIYTRHTEGCEAPPSSCYSAVVNKGNVLPGTKFGGQEGPKKGIQFVNATSDMSHIVFKSEVPLTAEPASATENLYEWTAGQLQLVNVLPNKEPAKAARLGGEFLSRNALSSNGSRVIFSIPGGHLYTRDMTSGETVQVDATQKLGGEEGVPVYQTASSDGLRIFFTEDTKLTEGATAAPKSADLYEYNVTTKKLTDLSVDPHFKQTGESAGVQGLLPGASNDGSTAYFVANGVLTSTPNANGETAQPGHCVTRRNLEEAPSGATCNLYVEHEGTEGEAPTFIGRLSAGDIPDWVRENGGNLENVTSKVSESGQYFAFMSNRRLTGYDNRDTNPEAHEAADEEVFLYDAGTGHLTCASCNPSGARPKGVFDGGGNERSEEGVGLLNDRTQIWEGKWLAGQLPGWTGTEGQTAIYQSRYLSDSGRLFFNSADQLAAADSNGRTDVYEYEPDTVGGCATQAGCTSLISSGTSTHESAFLDASANGDDVFFLTSSALVTADHDAGLDVYDARVCGAAGCIVAPATPPSSCNSTEECRPSSGSTPSFNTPASVITASGGNLGPQTGVLPEKVVQKPTTVKPLTRAQRLAKALKACRKLKKKSKRTACEKAAHKKYGPKKKAKKGSHTTKGKK